MLHARLTPHGCVCAGVSQGKVDKYGRKQTASRAAPHLARFYEPEDASTRLAVLNRIARGEVELSSSSSSSSDEDDEVAEHESVPMEQRVEPELVAEATGRRLAVMNCDWDRLRAVDILALMRSFLPAGSSGEVLSVSIYPSEFGLKRLAEEETEGPRLSASSSAKAVVLDDVSADEVRLWQRTQLTRARMQGAEEGDGFDPEALRAYEKDRLLYYFAVATCDALSTAAKLYEECDGVEYGHSGNTLDVRFVPDAMEITTRPKETASAVPENYSPEDFVTSALQSSKVQLTWDEPEFDRRKLESWDKERFKKKGGAIKTAQLAAFLGSESDDDEDEDEARKRVERYRALLDRPAAGRDTKPATERVGETDDVGDADDGASDDDDDEAVSADGDAASADGEPARKSKKKKKKRRVAKDETADVVDVADDRFADLYTNPSFALDRTHPRFKATKASTRIEDERRKRIGRHT